MKMNQWPMLMALAMLCFFYSTSDLSAQRHRGGQGKAVLENHKADLNLTAEQEAQIKQLDLATKEKMEALRNTENNDPEKVRAQMRNLKEEHRTQMEQILTTAQKAKLKELRQTERAEHQEKREAMQQNRKAMHVEMTAYKAKEVLPVLRTQRTKLDAQISAADKAKIAELRTTIKEAKAARKEQHKAQRKEGTKQGEGRKGRRHHGAKAQDSEAHAAQLAIKEQVKALVEKYETDIDRSLEEIKPQAEKWRTDQEAIAKKYRPLTPKGKPDSAPEGAHFKHRGPGSKMKHGKKHAAVPRKAAFLLMDPNNLDVDQLEEGQATPAPVEQLNIYPNPAQTASTFAFDVLETGDYTIDLRGENGNVIRTLAKERFRAGEQELNVDLSGLRDGVYIISVTSTKGQVITTRFVKGG